MAQTANANAVFVGPEDAPEFWSLMDLVRGVKTAALWVQSGADLPALVSSLHYEPSVIVICAETPCLDLPRSIRAIHDVRDCEVVVATWHTSREKEIRIRTSGISCYLILPDDAQSVSVVVECAVRACRKRREAGVSMRASPG